MRTTIHVKCAKGEGDWTEQLYKRVQAFEQQHAAEAGQMRLNAAIGRPHGQMEISLRRYRYSQLQMH